MDLMGMAAACHAALAGGKPLDMPLAFAAEVGEARLDGSLDSMARLDTLLADLRQRHRPTPESLDAMDGGEALLILLGMALGLAVERATQASIEWLDRTHAAARLPADMSLPEERWARLTGVVVASPMVPLAIIESALFSDSPDMSCQAYAHRWITRIQDLSLAELARVDQNARCAEFLEALASGQRLPQGLAYQTALKQAQLDYSAASLTRLDALLRQIRQQQQPQRQAFVSHPTTQNFMRMVAFYTAMCTARLGQLSIKWLNLQELADLQGEVSTAFEASCGCLMDGKVHFPLALVAQALFLEDPPKTLESWSRNLRFNASSPMISLKRQMAKGLASAELPAEWAAAARQAGHFAAQSLFMVEGGSALVPQVLEPQGKGTRVVVFGMQADDSAYEASIQRLQANPGKLPWQVRATDGHANLPTGRTDAITVELRCYPGGFLTKRKPLSLNLTCPYRNASDVRGFAIYSPKLLSCDAPAPALAGLFKQFYDGIDSFHIEEAGASFSWDRYLDESV